MIKDTNKRITITIKIDNLDKLRIIMIDLKTKQSSKVFNYLIENYRIKH